MNIGINTAVSALNAYSLQHTVNANNIANINTDGFKKERVLIEEQAPQGVSSTFEKINTEGSQRVEYSNGNEEIIEGSNVELAEEMPNEIITQRSFDANTTIIKTENEMLGTILDMIA